MALLNISLNSNTLDQEIVSIVPPDEVPIGDLITITNPTTCSGSDGSIVINDINYNVFFTYSLTSLIENVQNTITGTTGSFTGLTAGSYFLTFVSKYPTEFGNYTFNWIFLNDPNTSTIEVKSYDTNLNHIRVNVQGKIIVNATPSTGNTFYVYDVFKTLLSSGNTVPFSYSSSCGTYYIQVEDGNGCLVNYVSSIKTKGTFSSSGIKRILYTQDQSEFRLNFDPTLNYITNIENYDWENLAIFNTDNSLLTQELSLNGSTQEYNQTLSLEINNDNYYGGLWNEFIKPSIKVIDFLIQDNNDNWWYMGDVNKAYLTNVTINKSNQENTILLEFKSDQKTQLKQVDPSYLNLVTIYPSQFDTCQTFYNSGIQRIWFAEFNGSKFPIDIVNNFYTITSLSGVNFIEYVVNPETTSFACELAKDQIGQIFNLSVSVGWGYIGDSNQDSDLLNEEEDVEFLIRNKVYCIIKDNNDRYWFFGRNNGLKAAEFSKGTNENQYTINFTGYDWNVFFVSNNLL